MNKEKIQNYLDEHPVEFEWGRRNMLNVENKEMILGGRANEVTDEIIKLNETFIFQTIGSIAENASSKFDVPKEKIYTEFNMPEIKVNLQDTGKLQCLLRLLSNYDCMASAWMLGNGGFSLQDSYLGDVLETLKISKKGFKSLLETNMLKVNTQKYKEKNKDTSPIIKNEELLNEIQNTTCGCNLLTIPVTIGIKDIIEKGHKIKEIDVSNCLCGFYSNVNGGGSLFETKIPNNTTIKIGTEYPHWSLIPDTRTYSMYETYGWDRMFQEAKIIKAEK